MTAPVPEQAITAVMDLTANDVNPLRRSRVVALLEVAAPAIREAGIHEGVALERQRVQDASTMAGYIQRLEEIARIARDMFACIDDADYPPLDRVELWRTTLAGGS